MLLSGARKRKCQRPADGIVVDLQIRLLRNSSDAWGKHDVDLAACSQRQRTATGIGFREFARIDPLERYSADGKRSGTQVGQLRRLRFTCRTHRLAGEGKAWRRDGRQGSRWLVCEETENIDL